MPVLHDDIYELAIEFNSSTLLDVNYRSRFVKSKSLWPDSSNGEASQSLWDMPESCGILDAGAGSVTGFLAPGCYSYRYLVKAGPLNTEDWENWGEWADTPGTWHDRIRSVAEKLASAIMEQVLLSRFGA